MEFDAILTFLDRLGVYVFSLSGGIVAARARMDLFGVITLALLPAVGGGTLRDLILDVPVFWLDDPLSIGLAIIGGLTAFAIHKQLVAFRPLRWADALGMALFAATGAAKTHGLGLGFHVVVMMAVMTATFGGLLRDVVANREPMLLKEDIYAAAALAGGITFWLLSTIGQNDQHYAVMGSALVAFLVRGGALIWGWHLPTPRSE